MENMTKAIPFIAIAALTFGIAGLVLGFVAFQKTSQIDEIAVMKDANSTISESVAGLQEEVSGLSKKYVAKSYVDQFADSTQGAFTQIAEQLTKVRTQSRADTIKIAELEAKLTSGVPVRAAPTRSSASTSSSTPQTSSSVPPGGTEYVIQSGDTLGRVATQFGISLSKLQSANPSVQPRYLKVGQKIVIPE